MFLLTSLFVLHFFLLSSIFPSIVVQVYAQCDWTIGQDVNTTSGIVSGNASYYYPEVSEYLGIPFGESTAGSQRWLPPTRYYGTGHINGTSFGAACPQSLGSSIPISVFGINPNQSEDCLTINVWTAPQKGEAKKAVMLWVYGGAFQIGDSSVSEYNGAVLANNQDVVAINFNYRLSVWGFPGAPGLEQQNVGLLDQRLAVEWVRDNVAAFGGDPDRITLFGESAGAWSVDFYSYIWTEDPIVNGLIAESGNVLGEGGPGVDLLNELDGYAAWYNLSSALGCGGEEYGAATVDCARNKTVDAIWNATYSFGSSNELLSPTFVPWIDNKTVFSNVVARANNGQFIRKPLLIGTNYNESILFSEIADVAGAPLSNATMLALNNNFRCGARDEALAKGKQGLSAWRYLYANNIGDVGATHGDEVPLVFGNNTGMSGIFQTAWAAFAKDPVNGLLNYGWPKYTRNGK